MEQWQKYLATIRSYKQRAVVLGILALVESFMPEFERILNYGIPSLSHKGKPILAVAANKAHIGIYPFGAAAVTAIKPYLPRGVTTTKGAIQFPYDQLPTSEILKRIIDYKLQEL